MNDPTTTWYSDIRQRHADFAVLWDGPVEAMTTPLTAAGAVTCAAAASAADVPALLAALDRVRALADSLATGQGLDRTVARMVSEALDGAR